MLELVGKEEVNLEARVGIEPSHRDTRSEWNYPLHLGSLSCKKFMIRYLSRIQSAESRWSILKSAALQSNRHSALVISTQT